MACAPRPGDQLRELRNRLGVTTREVEELSRRLAERTGNEEYYISNAWLTQLENKNSVPSIYKLFSLSVIYRSTFSDLLAVFGIDLASSARFQLDVPLANTHRVAFETPHPAAAVTFPIRLDRSFSLEKTNLVSRAVEVWGNVPASLFQRLDLRHTQYGYIGMSDFHHVPAASTGNVRPNRQRNCEHPAIRLGELNLTALSISLSCGIAMPAPGAIWRVRS